jgi:hypothetical protein
MMDRVQKLCTSEKKRCRLENNIKTDVRGTGYGTVDWRITLKLMLREQDMVA